MEKRTETHENNRSGEEDLVRSPEKPSPPWENMPSPLTDRLPQNFRSGREFESFPSDELTENPHIGDRLEGLARLED